MPSKLKLLIKIFIALSLLLLYCEFWIYHFVISQVNCSSRFSTGTKYILILQCTWPELDPKNEDSEVAKSYEEPVRIMVIADTHLLGPKKGHWFDKLRREWQMQRAFQTSVNLLKPEVVFILGDILDEGFYCSPHEFEKYVHRFKNMFHVPDNVKLYMVPGNHDVGFHYE